MAHKAEESFTSTPAYRHGADSSNPCADQWDPGKDPGEAAPFDVNHRQLVLVQTTRAVGFRRP